jgi:hypothetical protein
LTGILQEGKHLCLSIVHNMLPQIQIMESSCYSNPSLIIQTVLTKLTVRRSGIECDSLNRHSQHAPF